MRAADLAPESPLLAAHGLVGLPYVAGRFTCAHLAVLAQQRLFGRQVASQVPLRHPVGVAAEREAILRWRDELAEPVLPPMEPADGDAALFVQGWEHDEGWHIGTLLLGQHGERWVLHTHAGAGHSVVERLRDMRRRGLRLEGFYRWRQARPSEGVA
jgi:hypothetical protein